MMYIELANYQRLHRMLLDTDDCVFISYRSFESHFALKLAVDLKKAGIKLWIDRLDGIVVGMDWRQSIEMAIHSCSAMICTLSPDYVASEYCRKELGRANTLNRPIYPVMLHMVDPADIPIELEGVQWEDFTTWQDESEYSLHFTNLLKQLKKELPATVGFQPDAETSYLHTLLADLDARQGVLEYVEIRAQSDGEVYRPEPIDDDEWGFSELLTTPQSRITGSVNSFDSITEAAGKYSRFVLIGDPGSGKTTTLRRLAREAAIKRLRSPRLEPLPIFLKLSQWQSDSSPLEFICSEIPLKLDLASLLKNGQISLFLDGLNELGEHAIEKAKALRGWLSSSAGPESIIITCRSADYTSPEMQLPDLPTILAHPLEESQIHQFAESYLGSRSSHFLQCVLQENSEQLPYVNDKLIASRELASLVQNPYMLSALIYLYDNSPDKNLPDSSSKLFRKLLHALWTREKKRGTEGITKYEQAQARFAELAYTMINDGAGTDITEKQALESLGSSRLLHAGVASNYLIVKNDHVSFYHQLMQEYFASVKLRQCSLDQLAEPLKLQTGGNYVRLTRNDECKWYYPITMFFDEGDNLVERLQQICSVNPFFAVELMGRVDGLPENWMRKTARKIQHEADGLLSELSQMEKLVDEQRGSSGMWDDIEDSIRDCKSEVSYCEANALSLLGISKV